MKVINKEDLLLLINNCDMNTFDEDTFKNILSRYGDDWFIEDGEFRCVHRNERMRNFRYQAERITR